MTPVATSGLSSRAAAEAFVGGVCFKLGPPALIGAELEWPTTLRDGSRPAAGRFAAALGDYAPRSINPASAQEPLSGGSLVTLEPGGQVEVSTPPKATADELCVVIRDDYAQLASLVAAQGIEILEWSIDDARAPQRILNTPRYAAMQHFFERRGPHGMTMMCNSAAIQVSVDSGADADQVTRRWRMLNAIGPAFVAGFARGRNHGDTWASQRMRSCLKMDEPARYAMPNLLTGNPIERYAQWALDRPLMCVRTSGDDWWVPNGATFADWIEGRLDNEIDYRPTESDLIYHLGTLFPPVRGSGHLEVRYCDAQPGSLWQVPVYALEALTSSDAVTSQAAAIAAMTAGAWEVAAREGLSNPELRSAAAALLDLAAQFTPSRRGRGLLAAASVRCSRAQPPGREHP